jgi:PD-(D/E)XK nuclease superfamily
MSIKLSHSGLTTYQTCPKKYFLQYIEKLTPVELSSALLYGSALDQAFNDILLNIKKLDNAHLLHLGLKTFNKHWVEKDDKYLGKIKLAKNPNVVYSKKDYDADVLDEEAWEEITLAFEKHVETSKDPSIFEFQTAQNFFQNIRDNLHSFSEYEDSIKSFYNYVNWLSLQRKAAYMIEAYVYDLLPFIQDVVAVQVDLTTQDDVGNTLVGVGDFTVKLKSGQYGNVTVDAEETIIADNKSASKAYTQDSVATSAQLATYKVILNERGDKVKKGAYFVILKDLKKVQNKTCKSCGHKTTTSHKNCNAEIKGKRCGGEWSVELSISAQTQLVVDTISEEMQISAMNDFDDVVEYIKEEKFEENTDACFYQFGKPCPFLKLCKEGSMHGLVKQEKK